ncbi:hypothetical protein GQ600_14894 [Phytophthora cactorum]|nr:hypothetical protein GQ600_14894 [Phytophthora cactorum]
MPSKAELREASLAMIAPLHVCSCAKSMLCAEMDPITRNDYHFEDFCYLVTSKHTLEWERHAAHPFSNWLNRCPPNSAVVESLLEEPAANHFNNLPIRLIPVDDPFALVGLPIPDSARKDPQAAIRATSVRELLPNLLSSDFPVTECYNGMQYGSLQFLTNIPAGFNASADQTEPKFQAVSFLDGYIFGLLNWRM